MNVAATESTPAGSSSAARARATFAFAPVHKRALGVAVGTVFGLGVFVLTAFHVVFRPADALPLELLGQYFYGYDLTWSGAVVGLFWGFITGFVFGWFAAFVRNFVFATTFFVLRTRAELSETQDFLDHI